jgi:hypothetical protein
MEPVFPMLADESAFSVGNSSARQGCQLILDPFFTDFLNLLSFGIAGFLLI